MALGHPGPLKARQGTKGNLAAEGAAARRRLMEGAGRSRAETVATAAETATAVTRRAQAAVVPAVAVAVAATATRTKTKTKTKTRTRTRTTATPATRTTTITTTEATRTTTRRTTTSAQPLVFRARPAAGQPAGALVLFHGRGADEHDLEALLGALDRERRLVGFLPRGPLSLPPGGAHWYVVREVGYPDPETFLPTFEHAAAWLDDVLAESGIAHERTVLGGFSQGAVMSLGLGLGAGRPNPAAILAMSGFVPTVDGFELDLESRAGLPISISHGTNDPVISVEFGRDARDRLSAAGLDVTYREDPVGHTISAGALAQAQSALNRALGS